MLLSVREMEVRKLEFDTGFHPGEIEFIDNKLRQRTDLRVRGSAELVASTEEIRVQGRIEGSFEAECDRCLEPAVFPIDTGFDLIYRPVSPETAHTEREIDPAEAGIGYWEGGGIELEDVVREQVLLTLPLQWVCREDCKGICPVCGQNRNTTACSCKAVPVDDRWSALRDF